jgi:hypothetical protein
MDHFLTLEVVTRINEKCKKFHSLHLLDCKTNDIRLTAIKELSSLTTLRICSSQATFTDLALRQMFTGLKDLKHLALQVCSLNTKITSTTIQSLPTCCPKLRFLSLERCGANCKTPYFSPASLLKAVSALPHIEFLRLQFNNLLQEQNLRSMGPLTKLKFLDLACPGFFTADHLRAFISSLQRLPKMQIEALLGKRKQEDVFPSVRRFYTTDEISHFPDSLLRDYELPTRQIYPLTLEADGTSPSPQKEEQKEPESPLE